MPKLRLVSLLSAWLIEADSSAYSSCVSFDCCRCCCCSMSHPWACAAANRLQNKFNWLLFTCYHCKSVQLPLADASGFLLWSPAFDARTCRCRQMDMETVSNVCGLCCICPCPGPSPSLSLLYLTGWTWYWNARPAELTITKRVSIQSRSFALCHTWSKKTFSFLLARPKALLSPSVQTF